METSGPSARAGVAIALMQNAKTQIADENLKCMDVPLLLLALAFDTAPFIVQARRAAPTPWRSWNGDPRFSNCRHVQLGFRQPLPPEPEPAPVTPNPAPVTPPPTST